MKRLLRAFYHRYIEYSGPGGELLRWLDEEAERLERELQALEEERSSRS